MLQRTPTQEFCNMQRGRALQHATLTRGPPRNALVRITCCDARPRKNSAMHMQCLLRNEFKRIQHAVAPCARGMPQEHSARARIPAMPGKASTHTAQQERQHHPRQHEVGARGPRQATEAKPPPRAHIVDTSGNLASGTAAPDPSPVGISLVAELAVIVAPKRLMPGAKRCKSALASK